MHRHIHPTHRRIKWWPAETTYRLIRCVALLLSGRSSAYPRSSGKKLAGINNNYITMCSNPFTCCALVALQWHNNRIKEQDSLVSSRVHVECHRCQSRPQRLVTALASSASTAGCVSLINDHHCSAFLSFN